MADGISGDFPIFVVRIGDVADLEIVAQALRFQEYMRARGMIADLVIVNEQASSYVQDLQQAIETLCENSRLRGKELGPRQHIFAVRRDLMDEATYRTLLGRGPHRAAHPQRHHLRPDRARRGGSLAGARCLAADARWRGARDACRHAGRRRPCRDAAVDADADGSGLASGTASAASTATAATMSCGSTGRRATPQPWINVISNASFGFHTSAEGAAFTWSRNSRDYPADAMVERPGHQPAGRGDLHLRSCQRQGVLAVRRRGRAIRR